jgi:putative phage-type endonuclease
MAASLVFNTHADIAKVYGQISEEALASARQAVIALKNIPEIEQRSKAWYDMREQKVTTSNWGAVLGEGGYGNALSVLKDKCHMGPKFQGNMYTQYGIKYEAVACKIYERRNSCKVGEFGLIPHPTIDYLGASPDGITDDGIMLEIKVPMKRELTGNPLDTKQYWVQMQGQLEVCNLERCDFLECKIDEINDETYFNMTNNDLERGSILTFEEMIGGKPTLTYIYSHFFITKEEFVEWRIREIGKKILTANETANETKYIGTHFWKLVVASCVPVFRDRKWFINSLPKLTEFWEKVKYVRAHGLPDKMRYNDIGDPTAHAKSHQMELSRRVAASKIEVDVNDFF